MKRNARLFVVMLGLSVAGGAWAAEKPKGAVGPRIYAAVRTQKAVGPADQNAVRTQKAVGPDVSNAVRTQKTVGHDEKPAGDRSLLDLNAGF
ncbi:MAG: hypothetical protein ACXU86_08850 [Archangium sp.]